MNGAASEVDLGMGFLQGFALVIGLCIGSFLNVCIYRIPQDLSVVRPASRCPSCGHGIRPWDNVPVLSWVLLRGKCRDCGARISSLYPAIELLTGLVAWLLFRRIVVDVASLDGLHLGAFVLSLVLAAALIANAFVDLRYQIIPFELSLYLVPLFVGGWALLEHQALDHGGLRALGLPEVGFRGSALGAFLGSGMLAGVGALWRLLFRKPALGGGDVYLMALIGAGLGVWPALPYVLIAASLVGSVFGIAVGIARRAFIQVYFPFGPSLSLAALVYMTQGPLGARQYFERMAWVFGLAD
jgi:leader peptidase (prepilin peptidase) / N-methyltransferase